MLSSWPIRYKLLFGAGLLCLMLVVLMFSGFRGPYAFRQLARSVSRRAAELPKAAELTQAVGELRNAYGRLRPVDDASLHDQMLIESPFQRRERFQEKLREVRAALLRYCDQLSQNDDSELSLDNDAREWEAVRRIEHGLSEIEWLAQDEVLLVKNFGSQALDQKLEDVHWLSSNLPNQLHEQMYRLLSEVRGQYRTWIYLAWISSVLTIGLLITLVVFFYVWIFKPLRMLVDESRRITAGDLGHRIQVDTKDEVAELATAMNDMTDAFQRIRDHLDEQVRQRTREVVRSEQMASVGFLAAGVAHEINNPLASIAWCAESLESRVAEIMDDSEGSEPSTPSGEAAVIHKYLRRIQEEAFRCKGITEKLLDFSRLGDVERHAADLHELVQNVIEMVQTLGKYRDKRVELATSEPVVALVNSQEIKQVVLNLLTNALDSLDPGGVVRVELRRQGDSAELLVVDNGCGMTSDVLKHLFEPFFTRRRDGQGTGLGLSITYRIIQDHGGRIEAQSAGPGHGSTFLVSLPLKAAEKRNGATNQNASNSSISSNASNSSNLSNNSLAPIAA